MLRQDLDGRIQTVRGGTPSPLLSGVDRSCDMRDPTLPHACATGASARSGSFR
jgi:hypothetical protein